jgi:hypothetical protein
LLAQCRGTEQMRRGVLRAETVYGISTQAVYAQAVSDLGEPPTVRAALPNVYYYDYYPTGGAMAGAAGAAGAAGGSFDMGSGGAAGAAGGSFDMGSAGSASAGAAGAAGAGGAPAEP